MKSKSVYVSENPDHVGKGDMLDVISPKQLNKLLEEGWYITSRKSKRVKHPKTQKNIAVDQVDLSQESGVTVANAPEDVPAGNMLSQLVKGNEGVASALALIAKSLEAQRGQPGETGNSYLGRSIAGQIPGVGVVTPLSMHAAYGGGADAAKGGTQVDACPFPEGSYPFSQWVEGYLESGGKPDPEMMVAMEEGREAATGPDDKEVTCRWKLHTLGYVAWLFAFKKAGGRVEAGS